MYPDDDHKNVEWALFGGEYARESNPSLASVSLPVATLHRRTILSRRLTFKAINVTHDIESAFVGVS